MKIDYKNFPILEKLELGSLGRMPVFQGDTLFFNNMTGDFIKYWKIFNSGFKQEINIISESFREASEIATPKLAYVLDDILGNDLADFSVKGTYILGDCVYMVSFDTIQGSEDQELAFYIFHKTGIPIAMNVMSAKHDILETIWISNAHNTGLSNNKERVIEWIKHKLGKIIMLKMFKSYASVETKILKPKQKVIDIVCKYKNDTKLDLTFLDSKWFTNLVKSDAFNVRGHFRLQPKKINGEMSKELIWIDEFQKTGYTAPARILSQSN